MIHGYNYGGIAFVVVMLLYVTVAGILTHRKEQR